MPLAVVDFLLAIAFYFVKILEEEKGVFLTVLCARKYVPSDLCSPLHLHLFIAEEHGHIIIFLIDLLHQMLLIHIQLILISRREVCFQKLRNRIFQNELVIGVEIDFNTPLLLSLLCEEICSVMEFIECY